METNQIAEKIIGCAIEGHKRLRPGLLESAFEKWLSFEIKAIEAFAPVHEAKILTYMKFADKIIGLLIIFKVTVLKNGIKHYKN